MSPTAAEVQLRHPGLFVGLFAVMFCGLYALYVLVPDSLLRDLVYHQGICVVGADVINLVAPAEQASAVGNTIVSQRAILEIVRGCDGAGAMFLLIAAVLAFPAGWKAKLGGLLGAVLFAYAVNQARVVTLYFVTAYRPELFTALHTFDLPTLVVLLYCIAFGAWVVYTTGRR